MTTTTTKAQQDADRLLTPDELLGTPDPMDGTADGNVPDDLRDVPDPLAGTIGRLVPFALREKPDAGDPLGLTPDELLDRPDPLAGTIGELTPDELRGVDDEKPEPGKAPGEEAPMELSSRLLKECNEELPKLIAARKELLDREGKMLDEEKAELRSAFERAVAKRELEGDPLVLHIRG